MIPEPPIKILHTADLHLDSPLKSLALKDERLRALVQTASRTALSRMVQFAIDEGLCAILIAGDLFDGHERSAKTAAFLIAEMDRLKDSDIAVFYIKGNHDAENPVAGDIDLPSNVHVFDGRGGKVQLQGRDIWIHGVSFRDRHAQHSLLPKYGPPEPNAINIGLMHTSLGGAAGHDSYAPCPVSDLVAHGYDYWALGHVHKRHVHSRAPWVVMPGMPQGRDIGEAGAKSATLLTILGPQIEVTEIPVSAVEFRASQCDITGFDDDDALRSHLRAHLATEADATTSQSAILRLILTGTPGQPWQIRRDRDVWQATISELAENTGRLWVEQVTFDITAPRSVGAGSDAVGELSVLMAEILNEDGFHNAARTELEQMIALLPPERRAEMAPDEASLDALVRDLAQEGALSITALMKGANK